MPGFAGHGTPHPSGVRERALRRCGTRRRRAPRSHRLKAIYFRWRQPSPGRRQPALRLPASKTRRTRSFAALRRRSAASRRQPASKPTRRRTLLKKFFREKSKNLRFLDFGGEGVPRTNSGAEKNSCTPENGGPANLYRNFFAISF